MNDKTTPNPPSFGHALIVLGEHLRMCPDLPEIADIKHCYYTPAGYVDGLQIQLAAVDGLVAWARTLTGVTSEARRMESGEVFGYVYGRMDAVSVCVWAGDLPSEAFPEERGTHEWDVHAQLQET